MKISTNSRYALRFLVCLADVETRLTTLSIARAEGISEKMLERIAAKLGREGFVRSIKGIGGGYELARPADRITVTDILTVMETPYLPHHCVENHADCRRAGGCHLLPLWQRIDRAIRDVTDNVSIADIVREQRNGARQAGPVEK